MSYGGSASSSSSSSDNSTDPGLSSSSCGSDVGDDQLSEFQFPPQKKGVITFPVY